MIMTVYLVTVRFVAQGDAGSEELDPGGGGDGWLWGGSGGPGVRPLQPPLQLREELRLQGPPLSVPRI